MFLICPVCQDVILIGDPTFTVDGEQVHIECIEEKPFGEVVDGDEGDLD